MSKKNTTTTKPIVEREFVCGDVRAQVVLRHAQSGYLYRVFTLVRQWQSHSSGRTLQGADLFECNEDSLKEAITLACEHIRRANSGQLDSDPTDDTSVTPDMPADKP